MTTPEEPTMRERLAREMCKAARPTINPDRVVDMWAARRDGTGNVTALEFNPLREWHTRLPLVDAILSEMMEPSEGMKAIEDVHWDYSCHVCGGLKEGWQAMIQHIRDGGK